MAANPAAAEPSLLQALGAEAAATVSQDGPRHQRVRLTPAERVAFTSQLAMMVGTGVGIATALDSLAGQCRRPPLAARLREIHGDVVGGKSFSAALRQHPDLFDETYVATVAAGESSGAMAAVLGQLADLTRADLRLRRTIRGMLVYPVLLSLVSSVVVSILVVFVLPRFATIFEQYELTLPLVTRALLGLSAELRLRWWLWGGLAAAGVAAIVAARLTATGKRLVDTALVRTPGIGPVTRTLIGARACRMLGLLVESGVPLLDCLRLLGHAVKNELFRDLVKAVEDSVTNGRTLSAGLAGNEVLPASATEMIATAEKSGKLGEVARLLGAHYDEEGEAAARQIVSAAEPLVTIVMGIVVATVVMAVMLPVFDIATLSYR